MKDALKDLIDRHLPSPSHMDMAASRERILDRLRSKPAHLQTARIEDTEPSLPVSNVSRWRPSLLIPGAAVVVLAAAVGSAILWPWDARVSHRVSYHILDGTVEEVDAIQTDDDGATLALTDGSLVEMRSNSALSLERAADGLAIRLRAGDIIVSAAKQRTGHLYVYTKDMTVSVVGTVFFVSAAGEGSRVGVIEGEVRVREGTTETRLRPGEQVSTSATPAPPLRDEIAWSRRSAIHLALLNSFMERITQSAAPVPSAQTTQSGGTTAPPAQPPAAGRGGDPNAAIGAPYIVIPPPGFNSPNVGGGTISGVVTDAATGAPVEGALVSLTGAGTPGQPLANRPRQMTDSKGRFIFPNLAPSSAYTVRASRPGFLYSGYRSVPGAPGPDAGIRLTDGEWFREADIKLRRPAAVSGTVRDERGEPLVGAQVRLLVGTTVAGHWRWGGGPLTQTDDRGIYRFSGLSKGRYLVHVPGIQISLRNGESALYRPPSANTAGASNQPRDVLPVVRGADGSGVVAGVFASLPPDDKDSVYAPVFYPAARSVDRADPIALEFGADRTDVDIQMTPVPSVSVSGTVAGAADIVPGIPLRLVPAGNEMLGQLGDAGLTSADGSGRFFFHNVPAGDYTIIASRSVGEYGGGVAVQNVLPVESNPFSSLQSMTGGIYGPALNVLRARGADAIGRLRVSVGNRSIDGLTLSVTPAVSVSGYLEWDGVETPPAALSQSTIFMGLEPADADVTLGQFFITARTNGGPRRTFTFENVKPGRYVLSNIVARVTDPGSLSSISHRLVGATWNGRDIITTPLEVTGDEPVTGIVLQMSSQTNKITGTVRSADGRLATEGAVIAFPPSPTALLDSGLSAIRFHSASIAPDGTYELPTMIPGDYLLAAMSTDDQDRWIEPEFLTQLARQATRLSVGLASTLSQDLRIVNISGGGR